MNRVPEDKTISEILRPYIDPEKSDPVIRQRYVLKSPNFLKLLKMLKYLLSAYLLCKAIILLEFYVLVHFTVCAFTFCFHRPYQAEVILLDSNEIVFNSYCFLWSRNSIKQMLINVLIHLILTVIV